MNTSLALSSLLVAGAIWWMMIIGSRSILVSRAIEAFFESIECMAAMREERNQKYRVINREARIECLETDCPK